MILNKKRTLPILFLRSWLSLLFSCLVAAVAHAQLRVAPIEPFQAGPRTASPTATARPSVLQLPFFDDFSLSTPQTGPDPALWIAGSGVYINNTLPINHPSVNVVTFDGLRANGAPYSLSSPNAFGATDTLTSQPIDLAGRTPADNIFLSFYWQRKGLAELPDEEDSLRLEFLNNAGTWKTVWIEQGAEVNNNFSQAFIAVGAPEFLHGGFQFRFLAFGRQTGLFDAWHLDYVYLNRGRSATDRYTKDIATRQAVTPYLKRYTAMPLKQYLANPAGETADTIKTDIVNLFNNFNFTSFRFSVRDIVSGQLIQQTTASTPENIGSLSSQVKFAVPQALPGAFPGQRVVLQSQFNVLTTDDQNPSIPSVNLRRNDTISAYTVLDDYYAYDDGTAEGGLQLTQRQGRVAMRFMINKPDTVSGVRICLVPVRTDLSGKVFVVSISENAGGQPGRPLYQKAFTVQYPATRNGFVDFKFDNGVVVKDTFYIGWTQVSEENLLAVGFDKNSPFGRQVSVNLGSSWESAQLTGVPMLRPVIGGKELSPITGIDEEPSVSSLLRVFPNPNPGLLNWDAPDIRRLEVLDMSGRIRLSAQPTEGQRQLDISGLPMGMYLIRLSDGKRTVVQKIILSR